MTVERRARVLVVTDRANPSPALLRAIASRAATGDVQFRLVVLNPARAEVHLLHPERHDKAFEAECVLLETLPHLEAAAGGRVIGSVSVRHDPVDAIEETILSEPVDEIMLALPTAGSTWRLRPDLPHRLQRFGVPVTRLS
ncbi:hypothetical protein [Pedococcus bigeumensis]|uniref:Universal stress protein family protein n=1 Tax=Pedococcus bigeumensis TaxID=433644 RepID=A0A502CZA4_9MICO|nr:hypothetical protein [Pedococcus bigeumensis]TPG18163.1 hypothetical protein EAH86_07150 [Pedococcus bigeumensis]